MVNGLECGLQNSQVIPNQACRFGIFFWAPFRNFFLECFDAFPGNVKNIVEPADPTIFLAFPGNARKYVGSNPDLAFLAKDILIRISWKCGKTFIEKCSGMGPRKKFRNLQAWLGVPGPWLGVRGQVWPRPDFQVGPKTSKMVRNGRRIHGDRFSGRTVDSGPISGHF